MVLVDFHTHFYAFFKNGGVYSFLEKQLERLHVFKPSRIFCVVADTRNTGCFDVLISSLHVPLRKYKSLEYGSVKILDCEVNFIRATQIKDPFGCEFTKIGDSYLLNHAPFKYALGVRRAVFLNYLQKNMVIGNSFSKISTQIFGSDVLPYKWDRNNFLMCGSAFKKFDIDDFLSFPFCSYENFLGSYNLVGNKFIRLVASQKIFTSFVS